jgi:hypothetical protein
MNYTKIYKLVTEVIITIKIEVDGRTICEVIILKFGSAFLLEILRHTDRRNGRGFSKNRSFTSLEMYSKITA